MKNLPPLRNNSSFAVQFSILVSKTRAILLFTIKIIEMFELHTSKQGMLSAESQATIPRKFLIITHNYENVQTINQSKSLPGFRVVMTSAFTTRSNRLKFRLHFLELSLHSLTPGLLSFLFTSIPLILFHFVVIFYSIQVKVDY